MQDSTKPITFANKNYMMPKLSIVIPVYNVERFIRPCLESVFRQGLDDNDYEVIIINDGTKDKSMEMIADIICLHKNITVINQENQGLSVVRNNGILVAKGDYILMPDSDDLLIDNSLKPLLEAALLTKADLVVADFVKMNEEEIDKMNSSHLQQEIFIYKEKTGEQLFLEDLNPYQCYVWRTLFRRSFLLENNIRFVPGIYIQDVPFTHECYIKARKCLRTSWLLNIYRKGHESSTSSFKMKLGKDFCTAIAKTWELTNISGLTPSIQKKLKNDIYTSFSFMICSTSHAMHSSEREEIIDFLKKQAPDLDFNDNSKQKLATFMYRNMPHIFIHLRHYYGKIVEDLIRPFISHKLNIKGI